MVVKMDIGRKLTEKDEPWKWAFGLEENEEIKRAKSYESGGFRIVGDEHHDEVEILLPDKEIIRPSKMLNYFKGNKPEVWNEKHIQYKKAYDYFLIFEDNYY